MPDVQAAFCGPLRLYITCEPKYISLLNKRSLVSSKPTRKRETCDGAIAGSGKV